MTRYEYKVIPAPARGQKAKGIKTAEARFALSVETVMNAMAAEGWQYLRAELLPSEERSGLAGTTTTWRNVLVFRRPPASDAAAFAPRLLDPPVSEAVAVAADPPRPATGAEVMLKDNGVEELSEVSGMTASLLARAQQQAGGVRDDPADDAEDATVVIKKD
jgi:hypothetical protein